MLLLGLLDRLLLGASLTVYGVLFLPVSLLAAVWVRRSDLVTVPVVVPIAFTLGLASLGGRGDGFGDRAAGLFTALATEAGWLYGGTLIAGVVVTARKVRMMRRRVAARRRTAG